VSSAVAHGSYDGSSNDGTEIGSSKFSAVMQLRGGGDDLSAGILIPYLSETAK
jgi:hypothetical protein